MDIVVGLSTHHQRLTRIQDGPSDTSVGTRRSNCKTAANAVGVRLPPSPPHESLPVIRGAVLGSLLCLYVVREGTHPLAGDTSSLPFGDRLQQFEQSFELGLNHRGQHRSLRDRLELP